MKTLSLPNLPSLTCALQAKHLREVLHTPANHTSPRLHPAPPIHIQACPSPPYAAPTLTCPKAVRDLLMEAASSSLGPLASVLEMRSDPARSHRVRVPWEVTPEIVSVPSTRSVRMRWERELLAETGKLKLQEVTSRHVVEVGLALQRQNTRMFPCSSNSLLVRSSSTTRLESCSAWLIRCTASTSCFIWFCKSSIHCHTVDRSCLLEIFRPLVRPLTSCKRPGSTDGLGSGLTGGTVERLVSRALIFSRASCWSASRAAEATILTVRQSIGTCWLSPGGSKATRIYNHIHLSETSEGEKCFGCSGYLKHVGHDHPLPLNEDCTGAVVFSKSWLCISTVQGTIPMKKTLKSQWYFLSFCGCLLKTEK
ncbi:hypothetical protein JZ751_016789 [Albula glossodonta]|uniref:Uncharacterized protein n=1 Tax=Albula glossodonta TaxID=121402 RepID=A0A8T2P0W6_9TELE|nr:hypothetical protein JZ751_016789 [Albula glossodonta]